MVLRPPPQHHEADTPEGIVTKLRRVGALIAVGSTVADAVC